MNQQQTTTVIVFHSYPKKPCVDGLMSAILAINLYTQQQSGDHSEDKNPKEINLEDNIRLVPYWRTKESFERIKKAVESKTTPKCQLVYVDCSPDLQEEVDYLMNILPDIEQVTVYDHHPQKPDSPMNKLIQKPNFNFVFDSDNCVALMLYKMFTEEQKALLNVSDLLTIIQFSEYEGMNASVAGKGKGDAISLRAFENVKGALPNASENIQVLLNKDMGLFYILDQILSKEDDWKFLFDNSLSHDELYQQFLQQSNLYLETSKKIVAGQNLEAFGADRIERYLQTVDSLPDVFSSADMIKQQKIGEKCCDILVMNINIFDYGRCLEPILVKELQRTGASFGILKNKPTTKPDGKLSYYFSLRRVGSDFDARDLAKFVLNYTGSEIGGGHPWASGVTLNEEQYGKFQTLF